VSAGQVVVARQPEGLAWISRCSREEREILCCAQGPSGTACAWVL